MTRRPNIPTPVSDRALEQHRRQRELVAASLLMQRGRKKPTHRRWA